MTPTDPLPLTAALSPSQFATALRQRGRRRAALYTSADGQVTISTELGSLRRAMQGNARDFAEHEAILLQVGEQSGALMAAFIHCSRRGQATGGVRHWGYATLSSLLDDGLRLSRGMTRKNALAGLWWGGGKGIIAAEPDAGVADPDYRCKLFTDYGRFVTSLRGSYITAEDVGTTADDMAWIYAATRFATCVPQAVGGSGNPSGATARGVVAAMTEAVRFAGLGSLSGKTVAMQGAGNVARFMMQCLLEQGVARIVVHDISAHALNMAKSACRDERVALHHVSADDTRIFATQCDILAPNALGGVLHTETIDLLQARVVCGAANNMLLDDRHDAIRLHERGIVHVPDFVANRMGIVQCANEQYGWLPSDPAILRHFDLDYPDSIPCVTRRVLERAVASGVTSTEAANTLADELSRVEHPLWPGRTRDILQSLQTSGWEQG